MSPLKRNKQKVKPLLKSPTGIPGMDEITAGGLPKGRPTLVAGGAGFDVRAILNDPKTAHGLLMIHDLIEGIRRVLEGDTYPSKQLIEHRSQQS